MAHRPWTFNSCTFLLRCAHCTMAVVLVQGLQLYHTIILSICDVVNQWVSFVLTKPMSFAVTFFHHLSLVCLTWLPVPYQPRWLEWRREFVLWVTFSMQSVLLLATFKLSPSLLKPHPVNNAEEGQIQQGCGTVSFATSISCVMALFAVWQFLMRKCKVERSA